MKYKLKVYSIYEMGQRTNQEDALFPEYGKATEQDRLFILCDGMGGHECGEVASQTVCEAMSRSILSRQSDTFTDEMLNQAVTDALDALDKKDNGAAQKMGTTMTLLSLHAGGCTIAHIGDSRVYHIRQGATKDETLILHKTEDHSLVNYLIKAGQLTPEEAKHSKQKNVITRAMQPNVEKRPKADVYHSADIRPGDYFYLCSDGMLEQMEDDNLRFMFSAKIATDEDRVKILVQNTAENKDNHAAFLVHITDVLDAPVAAPSEVSKTSEPTNKKSSTIRGHKLKPIPIEELKEVTSFYNAPDEEDDDEEEGKKQPLATQKVPLMGRFPRWLIIVAAALMGALVVFLWKLFS